MKFFLLISTLAILVSGCNREQEVKLESQEELVFIDDLGREVRFDSLPERIVSMIPSVTENMYAIGAGEKLIGVTNYCNYPEEAKNILKVGDINPDYELITSLNPDVIFIASSTASSPMLLKFESLGLKVYVTNPGTIEDIISQIEFLGTITGHINSANKLGEELTLKLKSLRENLPGSLKKSLIVIAASPLMTTNGNTFVSKASELAGYLNIFKDEVSEYPVVGYEDVILRDPEWFLISGIEDDPAIQEKLKILERSLETTDAVRKRNYIFLNPDIMLRSTPRLIFEIENIASKNY